MQFQGVAGTVRRGFDCFVSCFPGFQGLVLACPSYIYIYNPSYIFLLYIELVGRRECEESVELAQKAEHATGYIGYGH